MRKSIEIRNYITDNTHASMLHGPLERRAVGKKESIKTKKNMVAL
jgi:hypothetical protein